jgi:NAD(P)-dependent dehydrogenase (short-subunit alcohol dehydrogenase family)
MNDIKWAIITGADGGMGTEITRAVAKAGYQVNGLLQPPKGGDCPRLFD